MLKPSRIITLFCVLAASSAVAQAEAQPDMLQQMLQMQNCIEEQVDINYFNSLGQDAEARAEEIKQMCLAGKRDEAQDAAIDYALSIQDNPNFKALKACMLEFGGDLPGIADIEKGFDIQSLKDQHVCDDL